MRLGDIPLSQMTYDQCLEAVGLLQSEREGLRNEAIKEKKEKIAKAERTGAPVEKVKTPRAPRAPKAVDPFLANMLGMLDASKKS